MDTSSQTVLDVYKINCEFSVSIKLLANELTSNNTTLLRKLNEIYLNKCYNGKFITKINKIIKKTTITVKSGSGHIDVLFEASVLSLNPGDIIPYITICHVNSSRQQSMLGSLDNIKVIINIDNNLKHINIGHKIPITIDKILYQRNSDMIGVYGTVFRLPDIYYYKLLNDAKDVDMNLFNKMTGDTQNSVKSFDKFLSENYNMKNKELCLRDDNLIDKKIEFNEFNKLMAGDIVYCPNNKSKFDCCYKLNPRIEKLDDVQVIEVDANELFTKICRNYTIYSEVYKEIEENIGVVDYLKKCF